MTHRRKDLDVTTIVAADPSGEDPELIGNRRGESGQTVPNRLAHASAAPSPGGPLAAPPTVDPGQPLSSDRPWWASPERVHAAGGLYGGGWCQRHSDRRPTWRRTSHGGFDPRRYAVSQIGHHDAVNFVLTHHYAGSYPSVKLRYGLVERHSRRLVGVCTIGTPCNQKVLSNPLPKLAAAKRVAELNRLVLLDEVESNGESFLVGRALRDARIHHGLRAVIAFADPMPRPDIGMPGHVGELYRTLGAWYCDRATARSGMVILPDNTAMSDRSIQKVRGGERGAGGVVRRLQSLGAPPKPDRIDGTAWLAQAFAMLRVRRVRHRGVHRFIFALGTQRQRRLVAHDLTDAFAPREYPTLPDPLPVYR